MLCGLKPLPFKVRVSSGRSRDGEVVIAAIVVADDFLMSTTARMLLARRKKMHEMARRIEIARRDRSHLLDS